MTKLACRQESNRRESVLIRSVYAADRYRCIRSRRAASSESRLAQSDRYQAMRGATWYANMRSSATYRRAAWPSDLASSGIATTRNSLAWNSTGSRNSKPVCPSAMLLPYTTLLASDIVPLRDS